MTELSRKVCLLGDFGVGKTSLVARFVRNTFSDRYLTTVGAKVDTRTIRTPDGCELKMVLWDLAGNPGLVKLNRQYIRGAHGFIFVADGTRIETLHSALDIMQDAQQAVGPVPSVLLLNKLDLIDRWTVPFQEIDRVGSLLPTFRSSALSGESVEASFQTLAGRMLGHLA